MILTRYATEIAQAAKKKGAWWHREVIGGSRSPLDKETRAIPTAWEVLKAHNFWLQCRLSTSKSVLDTPTLGGG